MIIKISQPYLDTQIRLIMKTFMNSFSVYLSEVENFSSIEGLLSKKELSDEEKEILEEGVKNSFYNYVDNYCEAVTGLSLDNESKLRLKEIVRIEFVPEIKDCPEQGKSWYWVSTSDYCLNQ